MSAQLDIHYGGSPWTLYADGSAYLHDHKLLLIADVHLGKGGVFRAHGIPVPGAVHHKNLQMLEGAMHRHPEAHVVFLGDLIHGLQNSETNDLFHVLRQAPNPRFTLVEGNHDFDAPTLDILDCTDRMEVGPMVLLHEPPGNDFDANIPFDRKACASLNIRPDQFVIAGHLHPAAGLRGLGKNRATIHAFFFGEWIAVLPAFGNFTGRKLLKEKGHFYGLAENSIINLGEYHPKG